MNSKVDSLDGLRTLAVALVLLYHAGAPLMSAGWLGVDIFFVLSGFLITSLLVKEHMTSGHIDLLRFFARRTLRLFPAYAIYGLLITALILLSGEIDAKKAGEWDASHLLIAIWTYTVNFLPLGGVWSEQHLTRHLWSLSIEWQFYLFSPIILILALQVSPRWGVWLFFLPIPLTFLDDSSRTGFLSLSLLARGLALFVGTGFGYSAAHFPNFRKACKFFHLPALSYIFLTLFLFHFWDLSTLQSKILLELFWTCCGIIVTNFMYGQSSLGDAILSLPAVSWIGRISYGIYLWHMASWTVVWYYIDPGFIEFGNRIADYGVKLAIYFALSLFLASISFYVIERPFLRLKERTRSRDGSR